MVLLGYLVSPADRLDNQSCNHVGVHVSVGASVFEVAFLMNWASIPIINMDTGVGAASTTTMDKTPVDISAAMLNAAKYVERKGFVDRQP